MNMNEWMSYECSEEGTYTQNKENINSSITTCSHASELENRNGNRATIASVNGPVIYDHSDPDVYQYIVNNH